MGETLTTLSEKKLPSKCIFNNRFVVEVCEAIHVHYRNIRLLLSVCDWKELAKGMSDSLKRYEQRGCPETGQTHIELTRKVVASEDLGSDSVKINLNRNLYELNGGKIFAEGADLDGDKYIHMKIRDVRLELTLEEWKRVAEAVKEAEEKLCALSEPLS